MLKSDFDDYVENNNFRVEVIKFGKYRNITPNFSMFLSFCGENLIDPKIGFENLKADTDFVTEFQDWYFEQGK
jgi:hypothetical protein